MGYMSPGVMMQKIQGVRGIIHPTHIVEKKRDRMQRRKGERERKEREGGEKERRIQICQFLT